MVFCGVRLDLRVQTKVGPERVGPWVCGGKLSEPRVELAIWHVKTVGGARRVGVDAISVGIGTADTRAGSKDPALSLTGTWVE